MSAQGSFARIAREGGRAALVTAVEGPAVGRRVLIGPDGVIEGGLGDPELDARALEVAAELIWKERSERREELFVDVVAPTPRLLIFGAVEYANHLSQLASTAHWLCSASMTSAVSCGRNCRPAWIMCLPNVC